MKKLTKRIALVCVAVMTAIAFVRCGEPKPTPEPEPTPDSKPVITISTQPQSVSLTEGAITGNLTVAASVSEGATLSYQWYSNTSASNSGGTAVSGATSSSFAIPTDLTEGSYHYFAEVSAAEAMAVKSSVATVTVTAPEPPKATERYKVVPYTPSESQASGARTRAEGSGIDNLVFYDYEDDANYYFFVLGHVMSAPLAYRPAIYYNGTTPITVGYAATNVTESSISNSVTEANEHSLSKSSSFVNTNEVSATVGFEGGPTYAKFSVEASYGHTWTTTEEDGQTSTRSTSNTYETSSSKVSEITDEISVTIGPAGEPAGLYRFSLFTTTDVYFVVKTDRAKTEILSSEIVYCARPTQFWALDYDPSQGGSFGKTGSGDLLQIPDITIADLPDIAECEHDWGEWMTTLAATAATEGQETRTCKICGRTETRVIPVLRTGTFDLNSGKWIEGSSANVSYNSSLKILTVNDGARIIVVDGENTKTIIRTITVNGNAFITIKDVSIKGDTGENNTSRDAAIILHAGANLTLRPEGTNTFSGTYMAPGILTTGATLTIDGPGSLTANGGYGFPGGGGAGIGGRGGNRGPTGGAGGAGGTVIIKSGTVTAQGGNAPTSYEAYSGSGAGIGGGGGGAGESQESGQGNGGKGGAGGNITIYAGANVTAIPGTTKGSPTTQGAAYGGGGGGESQYTGSDGAQGDPGTIDDQRNP